jgi:hypothetical protein
MEKLSTKQIAEIVGNFARDQLNANHANSNSHCRSRAIARCD